MGEKLFITTHEVQTVEGEREQINYNIRYAMVSRTEVLSNLALHQFLVIRSTEPACINRRLSRSISKGNVNLVSVGNIVPVRFVFR